MVSNHQLAVAFCVLRAVRALFTVPVVLRPCLFAFVRLCTGVLLASVWWEQPHKSPLPTAPVPAAASTAAQHAHVLTCFACLNAAAAQQPQQQKKDKIGCGMVLR